MIRLIDTKTLHDVEVSGTMFRVRALDARQRINLFSIFKTIHAIRGEQLEGDNEAEHFISYRAYGELLSIMENRIDYIDGFPPIDGVPQIRPTIEAMREADLIILASKILDLSRLSEDEGKNLPSSSGSEQSPDGGTNSTATNAEGKAESAS